MRTIDAASALFIVSTYHVFWNLLQYLQDSEEKDAANGKFASS